MRGPAPLPGACARALLAALFAAPGLSVAHKGGIDPYGCHTDAKVGDYHCHEGILAGLSFRSRRDMLDAVDRTRLAPGDPPAAPLVSPPVFEPLRNCAETTSEARQPTCFDRIAPRRE